LVEVGAASSEPILQLGSRATSLFQRSGTLLCTQFRKGHDSLRSIGRVLSGSRVLGRNCRVRTPWTTLTTIVNPIVVHVALSGNGSQSTPSAAPSPVNFVRSPQ
jgi:hypothetical protein